VIILNILDAHMQTTHATVLHVTGGLPRVRQPLKTALKIIETITISVCLGTSFFVICLLGCLHKHQR